MKTKRFNFRVSDTVDALIRKKAKDANINLTDYIILSAMDKAVVNYDGLKEITAQIKKVGNNLNQLVILSRQGKITVSNLSDMQNELKEIHLALSEELKRRK